MSIHSRVVRISASTLSFSPTRCFYSSGAKDSYLQVPNSAALPVIMEMDFLRNHSHIIKAKLEAQTALAKERANHAEQKLQVKQQKNLMDNLQKQIETLHTEKMDLQSNKTVYGEAGFFLVSCVILWLKWGTHDVNLLFNKCTSSFLKI